MSYLYVAEFSSGHIKVGRAVDVAARIAQHEARVACVGVSNNAHRSFECTGDSVQAETALINWCVERAARRHCSEWFEGIPFGEVCGAAEKFAGVAFVKGQIHRDSELIDLLGGPAEVARLCRVTTAAVSQWKSDGIPEARRMYLELLRPEIFADKAPA